MDRRRIAAGTATGPAGSAGPPPAEHRPAGPAPGALEPAEDEPPRRTVLFRSSRRQILLVCALVAVVVGLGSLATASPAAVPEQAAAARFDDAIFEGDVTIPDGSVVAPGERFTKVWQLRNTGSMRWEGRYLTRVNTTPCQAPNMVPIPATEPGASVRIQVPVTAGESRAHCKIYWKMTDATQRLLFPDKNPIFLDVVVGGKA